MSEASPCLFSIGAVGGHCTGADSMRQTGVLHPNRVKTKLQSTLQEDSLTATMTIGNNGVAIED